MTKTLPVALGNHLGLETTSLATLWQMTRVDGTVFFFTDHDEDISFDGDTYLASVGYNRTAVSNKVGLSVDNLDVTGFLDDSAISETDLRGGKFDKAKIRISLINWASPSDGIMRIRRGELGEVQYTDDGGFETELRGLTDLYRQNIVEQYQPECRADLGDSRCKVELFPDVVLRTTPYVVGDVVRASEVMADIPEPELLVPGDTDANDISSNMAVGTVGAQAAVQTVEKKFGAGSIEFSPSPPATTTTSFVSYPDIAAYTIGSSDFTVECWVRFKDLTLEQIIASHYNSSGNERGWHFARVAGALRFFASDDGSSVAPAADFDFAWVPVINTWYHVAVTRDSANDLRAFVDGVQIGSTLSLTFSIHDSTSTLNLGRFRGGANQLPLDGFIDDFRLTVGTALYTANFTPPAAAFPTGPEALIPTLVTTDFNDRIYTCTVAGTTAAVQPTYDTTLTNLTVDGTATFQAGEAFVRSIVVETVASNRLMGVSFPFGIDSRAVTDWFKYGATKWDTGDNEGIAMDVKASGITDVATTGVTTLDVDDNNTFSRASGSFITDGFVAGQVFLSEGWANAANNGQFTVQTVNALTMDTVETTLAAETGTGDEILQIGIQLDLFLAMPFLIQAGDTGSVYAGCDKRLPTCITKFLNVENYRGEPYVPGQDKFLNIKRAT